MSLFRRKRISYMNFFANDYCPRRLFLGPWRAVNLPDVMLNPTGMIETDLLLLDLMSLFKNKRQKNEGLLCPEHLASWRKAISKRGVPDAFFVISYYLDTPHGFPMNFLDSQWLECKFQRISVIPESWCPIDF